MKLALKNAASGLPSAQLLARARQGDLDAVGELLGHYRQYLRLIAQSSDNRRLQGKADASDLVQDALLQAHRQFPQFRGRSEAEFLAWLRCILAGSIANHFRRFMHSQCRDAQLERPLNSGSTASSSRWQQGLAAPNGSPSQLAVKHESARELAAALQRLPPDYRQIIVLRHFEALPFAEVAARMGRSRDSVEKLWVRALSRLRQAMGALP